MEQQHTNETFSARLSVPEIEALDELMENTYSRQFVRRRDLLRHIIISARDAQMVDSKLKATLENIERDVSYIRDLISDDHITAKEVLSLLSGAKFERRGRKSAPQEEILDEGKRVCELLDGVVDGNACRYKKYSVSPSGRRMSLEQLVPLAQLTDADIMNQYEPSKEAYDAASR